MADETTTQAATAAAAADAAKARADKDKASAEKWGKVAAEALGVEEAAAAAEAPAPAAGDKPRGKNGQFLPEKGKAKERTHDAAKAQAKAETTPAVPKVKAGESARNVVATDDAVARGDEAAGGKRGDSPTSPEAERTDGGGFTGGLGKARRLAREGNIAEALKLIDLDPEKIPGGAWASWRNANAKKAAEIHKRESDIIAAHQKVQSEAREIVANTRKFAEAKDALDAGDEERVFELVFGKSSDQWQREKLAKMHRGDLSKDPAVSDLTRRLDAERAERQKLEKRLEERDQKAAEQERTATLERSGARWREDFTERLAESGDERLATAAKLPWFVRMVHAELLKNYTYDEVTDTEDCISEEEAIEAVYDPERLTAAQWKQLTGGLSPTGERDPGTLTQVATDRRAHDVKRVLKAPTILSRHATVEAAPERRRSPEESLKHWSSIGQKHASEGKIGFGGK